MNTVETETEADSNDVSKIEHTHNVLPCTGMFEFCYVIFCTFTCPCMTGAAFALFCY